ncbi:RNA-directed DNA polymerase [Actinoplanes derwentensis]|uniref:Reverse transcriptase (RNA-dependent DNA polymerase) n=1 Tax=Actinoplanes derwentensis TaxID=113562 RepID=A0A1H2DCP5_9ACTN|nr:RNA-directed DNA polymerase [Actinoplanes derwentensis]SDT80354.1 Reverse transcriptase (RNA-dependent DNA polymerase) [Actinoplanes derwentensis]
MRPVPSEILAQLELAEAARREATAAEALMPSSPGQDEMREGAEVFARWLAGQLQSGLTTCRGLVVAVAKPETGSRPVAIWGFAERVTYRALTDLLMTKAQHENDRNNEAYQAFAVAPLRYAETQYRRSDTRSSPLFLFQPEDAIVQYVVKADLASFYDYIDHDILGRELLLRTSDHESIACLLDLLLEVQGRRYGIPQLLEPSDRLSDLYASRILRAIRRKQWPAWRYNDDFRIAAETFEDTKRALDDLTTAARDNGLVLNEAKTRTPTFITYWQENHVPDYVDATADIDPTWAIDTLNSTVTPREVAAGSSIELPIHLQEADRAATRRIRHALIRLSDPTESRAVEVMAKVEHIVAFVPSTTPYVLRYLRAMASVDHSSVTGIVESLTTDVSLSGWQRLCLIRTIREIGLTDTQPFTDWVKEQRGQRYEPTVRAEAALALAAVNLFEVQDVVRALDEEPSALANWYLACALELRRHRTISDETYDAIRDDSGLHAAILASS